MVMGVLLVIPDGDVLAGAVVVDRSTTLRMAGLGNTLANRATGSWGVQPGKDRTSGRVMLPPGRLKRRSQRHSFPKLHGVLTVRRRLKESHGRHEECC